MCITQLARCSTSHGFICELTRVIISQNTLIRVPFCILPAIPQPLLASFIPHFTFRIPQFRILPMTSTVLSTRQRNYTNALFGRRSLTTGVVFSFQSSITHSDAIFRQQQRGKLLKSTAIYAHKSKHKVNSKIK